MEVKKEKISDTGHFIRIVVPHSDCGDDDDAKVCGTV